MQQTLLDTINRAKSLISDVSNFILYLKICRPRRRRMNGVKEAKECVKGWREWSRIVEGGHR